MNVPERAFRTRVTVRCTSVSHVTSTGIGWGAQSRWVVVILCQGRVRTFNPQIRSCLCQGRTHKFTPTYGLVSNMNTWTVLNVCRYS